MALGFLQVVASFVKMCDADALIAIDNEVSTICVVDASDL